MLNPNHYSQNIGLTKYYILWKYASKILNGCLLQWCYCFVHMLRYFAGLKRVLFSENQPKYTEISNFSFVLPWHRLWWIHHECLRFSVDKCRPTAKVCSMRKVVCFLMRPFCFYTLTTSQIIQIVVQNQCKKKARGNPRRILIVSFQHSHNSLQIYCAS